MKYSPLMKYRVGQYLRLLKNTNYYGRIIDLEPTLGNYIVKIPADPERHPKGLILHWDEDVVELIPAWEQASKKEERAAARPIVDASRKNSLRLRLGFPSDWLMLTSLLPQDVDQYVTNASPCPA